MNRSEMEVQPNETVQQGIRRPEVPLHDSAAGVRHAVLRSCEDLGPASGGGNRRDAERDRRLHRRDNWYQLSQLQ